MYTYITLAFGNSAYGVVSGTTPPIAPGDTANSCFLMVQSAWGVQQSTQQLTVGAHVSAYRV